MIKAEAEKKLSDIENANINSRLITTMEIDFTDIYLGEYNVLIAMINSLYEKNLEKADENKTKDMIIDGIIKKKCIGFLRLNSIYVLYNPYS